MLIYLIVYISVEKFLVSWDMLIIRSVHEYYPLFGFFHFVLHFIVILFYYYLCMIGHSLSFLVSETYGEESTSILETAELWKKNISAFIGPQETCLHEARMAAAFNLPMISYVSQYKNTHTSILYKY